MNKNEYVILGCFGRVHGIKGFITVHSYTHPKETILDYHQWYINLTDCWEPIATSCRQLTSKNILVKIDGYENREAGMLLTNRKIAVERHKLPTLPDNEFYWHELIGLEVLNQHQTKIGWVSDILATGSNDVLVVTNDNSRLLVPYLLNDVVKSVDLISKTMVIDWDI
ncbi:MAG: 16S rRNA processing protein RimM [Legionellaceae bacterium]|nr:16S rRNA processing protein RimM [Legionellaceae bacterium]HCA90000.1 ribosome maturation factor RimM [Legionellales bacterium]